MSLSSTNRARALTSTLLLMLLAVPLSACTTPPPVFLSASDCASLVPNDWQLGIESAHPPADRTAGGWVSFGDAQTAQLDKANNRTKDAISIVTKCEARDREVAKALEPKAWWKLW